MYVTKKELEIITEYAKKAKHAIVELGILHAETTAEICKHTKLNVYGIDPILPDSMNINLKGDINLIKKRLAENKNFIFIQDFSFNVAKTWRSKFDFIFIDADHNYESVKKDFHDWYKLIENGGIIMLHDSAPITSVSSDFLGWDGPIHLVRELKEQNYNYLDTVDTITIFKKI